MERAPRASIRSLAFLSGVIADRVRTVVFHSGRYGRQTDGATILAPFCTTGRFHCRAPASHERLWRDDRLYDLVVVVDYNTGPIRRGRGSAIFLHVMAQEGTPTAGCVAIEPAALRRLLPRIGPKTRPRDRLNHKRFQLLGMSHAIKVKLVSNRKISESIR